MHGHKREILLFGIQDLFNKVHGNCLQIQLKEKHKEGYFEFTEKFTDQTKKQYYKSLDFLVVRMFPKEFEEQVKWLYTTYKALFTQYAEKELKEGNREAIERLLQVLQESRLNPEDVSAWVKKHYKKLDARFYMEVAKNLVKQNEKEAEATIWYAFSFWRLGLDLTRCAEAALESTAAVIWNGMTADFKEGFLQRKLPDFGEVIALYKDAQPYPEPLWLAYRGKFPLIKAELFIEESAYQKTEGKVLDDLLQHQCTQQQGFPSNYTLNDLKVGGAEI